MKTKLTAVILISASVASAYTPYVGGSAGYLTDAKEEFFAARLGAEFATKGNVTHSTEIEVGYTTDAEEGAHLKIVPVLLNYRGSMPLSARVSIYGGAGLGFSQIKLRLQVHSDWVGTWIDSVPHGASDGTVWLSDSDTAFSVQGFAGVEAGITQKLSFTVGGRYLWIGDTKLLGSSDSLGGDISVEAGLRWCF